MFRLQIPLGVESEEYKVLHRETDIIAIMKTVRILVTTFIGTLVKPYVLSLNNTVGEVSIELFIYF